MQLERLENEPKWDTLSSDVLAERLGYIASHAEDRTQRLRDIISQYYDRYDLQERYKYRSICECPIYRVWGIGLYTMIEEAYARGGMSREHYALFHRGLERFSSRQVAQALVRADYISEEEMVSLFMLTIANAVQE